MVIHFGKKKTENNRTIRATTGTTPDGSRHVDRNRGHERISRQGPSQSPEVSASRNRPMTNAKTLTGEPFRVARQRADLTLHQAAAQIDVDPATLASWESGETAPHAWDIVAMAKAYRCSSDYLLSLTDTHSCRLRLLPT